MMLGEATEHVIIATVFYVLGLMSGIVISSYFNKKDIPILAKENSNFIVLLVVSLAFFLSVVVDLLSPAYETSPYMYGLMGAIVGFFYKNQKDKNEK